jgi:hypothetical protein
MRGTARTARIALARQPTALARRWQHATEPTPSGPAVGGNGAVGLVVCASALLAGIAYNINPHGHTKVDPFSVPPSQGGVGYGPQAGPSSQTFR